MATVGRLRVRMSGSADRITHVFGAIAGVDFTAVQLAYNLAIKGPYYSSTISDWTFVTTPTTCEATYVPRGTEFLSAAPHAFSGFLFVNGIPLPIEAFTEEVAPAT